MTRPGWNAYFLAIAEAVAQRADCTRSKVGAVLVNARNEIRGTGYNGSPAGLPGCLSDGACPRGKHYPMEPAVDTVFRYCRCGYDWPCSKASEPDSDYSNCIADHAERNALRHSRPEDLKGATLYVTRPPCPGCTTLITACGIVRVVHPLGEDLLPEPPGKDMPECTHPHMEIVRDAGGVLVEVCDGCEFEQEYECTHLDNQVTLDKADPSRLIAWVCTCGARKEHGGKWSTSEECTHPWQAQTVMTSDTPNRIIMACESCGDVTYVEGGR